VPVLIEVYDAGSEPPMAHGIRLSETFISSEMTPTEAVAAASDPSIRQIQTKRFKQPTLDHAARDIRLASSLAGPRLVAETGRDVFIGVIDSGFDLSHPAFRDSAGNLRVAGLLEQFANAPSREFTTAQLQAAWAAGVAPGLPGFDGDGHGTHVASIAAGSPFAGLSGVAPEAKLLLVKTNFRDTPDAASWIFNKAGGSPCVINMSLGYHYGAHDGTDSEERLHRQLVATPGRAIVVSAGNERTDSIHIGGRFHATQLQEVAFDVFPNLRRPPGVATTLWYSDTDEFDISLITPAGQTLAVPAVGNPGLNASSSVVDIALARKRYTWSAAIQTEIDISFRRINVRRADLRGWRIRITCTRATVGRLDGWFANSGFAEFRSHPLVEESRTVGLPATGDGSIAVASHVSRNAWQSDSGNQLDARVVLGRSSPFSSIGPSRDGRQKPDISAPGQYVTAALGDQSESALDGDRALSASRLLTIEGTSMAAPVVTGVIALMLQKRPTATITQLRDALRLSAVRDAHSGPAGWDPVYGFGKIDVQGAVARI
jgi:subtilisin family serine protease